MNTEDYENLLGRLKQFVGSLENVMDAHITELADILRGSCDPLARTEREIAAQLVSLKTAHSQLLKLIPELVH